MGYYFIKGGYPFEYLSSMLPAHPLLPPAGRHRPHRSPGAAGTAGPPGNSGAGRPDRSVYKKKTPSRGKTRGAAFWPMSFHRIRRAVPAPRAAGRAAQRIFLDWEGLTPKYFL